MDRIYMDNAATSYPKPRRVAQAVYDYIRNVGGSAGRGEHQSSLEASELVMETRRWTAKLFHIEHPERIAFAMNITQAINFALQGYLQPGDHVITTSMEHNAVARPLHVLQQRGVEWSQIQVDKEGHLDLEELRKAIRDNTRMICMLHASNVTGDIMPITEVGKLAAENDLLFMVDSAQTAGLLNIDVQRDQIDILTFTGHKSLFGPQGIGGIYLRSGIWVTPLITGGTGSFSESLDQPSFMPDMMESGTANMPGIAGLQAGLRYIHALGEKTILEKEREHLRVLREGLQEIQGVKLYGGGDVNRQTPVLSFTIEGATPLEVGRYLEEKFHIICRAGLHCAVLAHQTLGTAEQGSCRLSPGYFTTLSELEQTIRAVDAAARIF